MAAQNVVKRVDIKFTQSGQREVVRDLQGVRTEATGAAAATEKLAVAQENGRRVVDRTAAVTRTMVRETERLQRSLDPLYRAETQLARAREMAGKSLAAQVIDLQRHNELMGLAEMRYASATSEIYRMRDAQLAAAKGAAAANDNIRLTTGQVQGLGYQINDLGTMLAMGASPFQLLASQGGQIVQVLGDGPRGVKGSLGALAAAVGGFARSMGPVGLAIGAATAAAGAMWLMSDGKEADAAKDSVSEYKALIDGLKDSFAGASAAADEVFKRAADVGQNATVAQITDALGKAKKELDAAMEGLAGGAAVSVETGTLGSAKAVIELFNSELRGAQGELRTLYAEFTRGEITAQAFVEQVAKFQIAPGVSDDVREVAGEMRRLGEEVAAAATNAEALQAAMDAIVNSRDRLPVPSAQDRPLRTEIEKRLADRLDPEGMEDVRERLAQQTEELTNTTSAVDEYAASVEAARATLAGSVDALRLQVETYGESAGAIAAARLEQDALAEAYQRAAEANQKPDQSEIDFIKEQAAEYGRLTDEVQALTEAEAQRKKLAGFDEDIAFRTEQLGRNDVDQRVAQQMRSAGLEYGASANAAREAQLRYLESIEDTSAAMFDMGDAAKGVFGDILDSIMSGEDVLDSFIGGFASVSGPVGTMDTLFEENEE